MGAVADAAAELASALGTVPGVRVYTDLGAVIDPPGVVLGPPALTWGGPCADPVSARWLVAVVVAADERALPRLWDLAPLVAAAVDTVPDAVVIRADPGVWSTGTTELPCYELQIETSL
ncbi:hypothetical protein [Pseudonocardia asaccharolytica]|uniref:Uncharacterized protein n=1 Tax=Pseudonocardia asaccharolytica DSM 44247 = NBRC 16224 TaxID=1123024 RepID=A0A511CYY2_9PSEU|nr:hypothetical protein [Pseudonocardia asaccharolytica]GEL17687.1 hypothetical protein PA7_15240 [Pseudonocardia asaccharolytica DSM 44247 = NBRC 16224]